MKDWLDSQRIEISCPNCSNEIGMTLGQLKPKLDLVCSACGHQISVNAAQAEGEIAKAKEALEDLRRTLDGLGQ